MIGPPKSGMRSSGLPDASLHAAIPVSAPLAQAGGVMVVEEDALERPERAEAAVVDIDPEDASAGRRSVGGTSAIERLLGARCILGTTRSTHRAVGVTHRAVA